MPLKRKLSVIRRSISERDFEMLLQQASECMKAQRPHLLKKGVPARRRRAS